MSVSSHNDDIERKTVQIVSLQFRRRSNFVFKELLSRFGVIYDADQFQLAVSDYSVNKLGDITGTV